MIANIFSLLCLLSGAIFILTAAIGMVRFGDTMSRVHAITKPQTIGLVLSLTGAFIRIVFSDNFGVPQRSDMGFIILLVLFALLTSPVTGQRIARVARREGLYCAELVHLDQPGPHHPAHQPEEHNHTEQAEHNHTEPEEHNHTEQAGNRTHREQSH